LLQGHLRRRLTKTLGREISDYFKVGHRHRKAALILNATFLWEKPINGECMILKKIFQLLLITFSAFLLQGCNTNENKSSNLSNKKVEKYSDQTITKNFDIEDKNESIRMVAVQDLADQTILSKIAINDNNKYVRIAAVENLTDQTILAKIAVDDKEESVRRKAVMKLTDQTILSKITVEDENENIRNIAIEKLNDQSFYNIMGETFVKQTPGIYQARIAKHFLPILYILRDKKVTDEIGKIKLLNVTWKYINKSYSNSNKTIKVGGESICFSIVFNKVKDNISYCWNTNFPHEVYYETPFLEAKIDNGNLVTNILNRLPQQLLAKIAVESKDNGLRRLAFMKLSDQTILAKIAVDNEDKSVREAAVRQLNDQTILVKIVAEDKEESVRRAAYQKLANNPR
jgi:hypothetical protein